ncbi:MAG: mechanosensitive ion channel [Chloroflexia bacterium]|nr:mechanosensitive ion channel [Chloroflexia bacterium]
MDEIWSQTRDELVEAYGDLVAFLIASVQGVVVLLVAVLVARVLRNRTSTAKSLGRLAPNIVALLANAASIITYIVAASIILGLFGANWTALLAVLSVSTVAISLALQDVLKNYIAGVYILLETPFSIGDRISIRDFEGEVETIEIRSTVLTNDAGERVLVPNATIFSEVLTNRSTTHVRRRTVVLEGLRQSPADVERVVTETLGSRSDQASRPPRLRWRSFSGEGSSLEVDSWVLADDGVADGDLGALRDAFPDATVRLAGE